MNISQTVINIFDESISKKEDNKSDLVEVIDVLCKKHSLSKSRLNCHKETIRKILLNMPKEFHINTGGGMSFLNLCVDKNGNLWGQHREMAILVILGIGLKLGEYCFPMEFWSSLPGEMPYIQFNLSKV